MGLSKNVNVCLYANEVGPVPFTPPHTPPDVCANSPCYLSAAILQFKIECSWLLDLAKSCAVCPQLLQNSVPLFLTTTCPCLAITFDFYCCQISLITGTITLHPSEAQHIKNTRNISRLYTEFHHDWMFLSATLVSPIQPLWTFLPSQISAVSVLNTVGSPKMQLLPTPHCRADNAWLL